MEDTHGHKVYEIILYSKPYMKQIQLYIERIYKVNSWP